MKVRSRAWKEIAEFYRGLVEEHGWDLLPLLRLVEEIATSRYVHGIHATTSLVTLCISQQPEFEMDQNMLRVDFEGDRFTFRYRESPYALKEWKKVCGRDEGFSTFEHVMGRLKWFLN